MPNLSCEAGHKHTTSQGAGACRSRLRKETLVRMFKEAHGCLVCGEHDLRVLDLDHRDPQTKHPIFRSKAYGSTGVRGFACLSHAVMCAELAKCDVLCHNCHRRKTARDGDRNRRDWRHIPTDQSKSAVRYQCKAGHDHLSANAAFMCDNRLKKVAFINGYKAAKGCTACGEHEVAVLDLDHRDPALKHPKLRRANGGARDFANLGLDDIKTELEKCEVLCANCHRRKTADAKDRMWGQESRVPEMRDIIGTYDNATFEIAQ